MNYDGTGEKMFMNKTINMASCLAVGWISRRLYYDDRNKRTVEVVTLADPNMRTVLLPNVAPRHIPVDPVQEKLYWSVNVRQVEKIEWSNLDGSERQILIEAPHIKRIVDMKISMSTGELCYSDGKERRFECIDTRTKRIRTVISNIDTHFIKISFNGERIYWVKPNSEYIQSIDENGLRHRPINFTWENYGYVHHIEAVTGMCPMFHSQCAVNNGGCEENTLCLLSPRNPSGKICKPISKIKDGH